jgi:hypothetical protein
MRMHRRPYHIPCLIEVFVRLQAVRKSISESQIHWYRRLGSHEVYLQGILGGGI